MRVAANLAWLTPGGVGGSEEYTVRLLDAVIDAGPADLDLRILGSPALFGAHPSLARADAVTLPGPMHRRPWRVAMESTAVHRATRDADVVHHFGGRVPARRHGCDVVTIHDLQPLDLPANFSSVKRWYLGRALPRSARSAALVVTPSAFVASTVVERFGVAADRVRPVPSTWDPEADRIDHAVAAGLGPGPVVLYPAVTHPHKRHLLLLEAMAEVARAHPGVTLVLTGGRGRAEEDVASAIRVAPFPVVRPGRVPAASLRGLFHRADVLAFPSAYEGFGLPVLEAMRAGVPVVASSSTALPEVVGEGGRLVTGEDARDWAEALAAAIDGGPEVEAQVARGRQRVERWRPEAAAARLVDAWRSLV